MNNIKYYAVKEQCDCLKRGIEKLLFEMFDRGVLKDSENTLQKMKRARNKLENLIDSERDGE